MKLSIIMPSKNEAEGIAYALEGWIRICEGLDYEIIVVDDSDDETPLIVKKYAEKYQNIKLICGERKGVGAARNLGFKHSTGEIIIWSDADGNPEIVKDDYINSQRKWLRSVLKCFEDREVDIVYSPCELWVTDSLLANACSIARIDFDVSSVAFAYRRSVFKGTPISEGITIGEDLDMFLTALKNARKRYVTKEPALFFAPVFSFKDLIDSHMWYGKEYLAFAKKHKKHGLINIGGCLAYFIATLLLSLAVVNWIFTIPFVVGVLGEYARQLKKFNICRKRGLLSAWLFIPISAYVQRIAFSLGFISGIVKYTFETIKDVC